MMHQHFTSKVSEFPELRKGLRLMNPPLREWMTFAGPVHALAYPSHPTMLFGCDNTDGRVSLCSALALLLGSNHGTWLYTTWNDPWPSFFTCIYGSPSWPILQWLLTCGASPNTLRRATAHLLSQVKLSRPPSQRTFSRLLTVPRQGRIGPIRTTLAGTAVVGRGGFHLSEV